MEIKAKLNKEGKLITIVSFVADNYDNYAIYYYDEGDGQLLCTSIDDVKMRRSNEVS